MQFALISLTGSFVGALPSEKVQIFIKKYMKKFEEAATQAAAAPEAPAQS